MKSIIIGTAGHVDHGKTRLVGRLTGTNTDRLKEEQQRGISIELGFARLALGDIEAGIVDVPGHEKFVRTMVAGAGGVDLALLVVAADEGVMPQTREHVEVLELLGVTHGLVALTKIDMVDRELVELAAEDVRDYLAGTTLAGAPVVPVSSETGEGLDALRAALATLAAATPERGGLGPFRLPIDRVFTLAGMGTVVTGTSWSGSVRVGDALELMPRGLPVRVRSLQVHERTVEEAHAGQRTAIAIHGIKHDELERGEVLVSPGRFQAGNMVTLKLRCLASCPWTLKHRTRLRFHFGTQEIIGRLVLLDREALRAGEACLGQARLESPAVCAPGDRVIVRFYSPMRTVAGGEVIEATAPKRRHGRERDLEAVKLKEGGDAAVILERAVLDAGAAGLADKDAALLVEKYPGEDPLPALLASGRLLPLGKRLFHADAVDALARGIAERAQRFQEGHPLAWGPARQSLRAALAPEVPQASFQLLLEHLERAGSLRLRGEGVRVGETDPAPTGAAAAWVEKVETAWLAAGLASPPMATFAELGVPADQVPDLVDYLTASGRLLRVNAETLVHAEPFAGLVEGLRGLFAEKDVITVGDVGARLEVSRKYSVPLLELCDKLGYTERRESERRRGPKL